VYRETSDNVPLSASHADIARTVVERIVQNAGALARGPASVIRLI
jgi:hypothetical protein